MSPEERDMLAAELALGVLEGEALAQALRLKLADKAFAVQVEAWQARLAPLSTGFGRFQGPISGLRSSVGSTGSSGLDQQALRIGGGSRPWARAHWPHRWR